jgi:hypothetical protein
MRSRARINDGGAIVGTATYSGSNTNIASGSHGVLLLPVSVYVQLMKLGSGGFEVLAEAWAYDQISEKDWLEWKWDFLQKFVDSKGANDATDDAYTDYLDHKMVKDDKFATAAAQRLSGIQIYDDEAIISSWLGGGVGFRRVGYMALKQRHPDLPAFDYQAGADERKQQLQGIETFLKSKKTVRGKRDVHTGITTGQYLSPTSLNR